MFPPEHSKTKFLEDMPVFRLYSSTFQVTLFKKEVKIRLNMQGISLVKMISFLNYIFPVLEFLNSWRSES